MTTEATLHLTTIVLLLLLLLHHLKPAQTQQTTTSKIHLMVGSKIEGLFIKLCHYWFPKVPFFLKMAFFVDLEVPFLSEI